MRRQGEPVGITQEEAMKAGYHAGDGTNGGKTDSRASGRQIRSMGGSDVGWYGEEV